MKDLHIHCDGVGLHDCSSIPSISAWHMDSYFRMSGSDCTFLKFMFVIIVSFNKSRVARGRSANKLCPQGFRFSKTLNHISQECFWTHGLRIHRLNTIANYLARFLGGRGYTVYNETIFVELTSRRLKPDIVAYGIDHTLVINAQVINDQFYLKIAHDDKVIKYEVLHLQLEPAEWSLLQFFDIRLVWYRYPWLCKISQVLPRFL